MKNKTQLSQKPRFAFREEYFGGLLLDYKSNSYELLNAKEFNFLKKIKKGELSWKDSEISEMDYFIKKLNEKNLLEIKDSGNILIQNIREIIIPGKISKNSLNAPLKVYDTYTRKCNLECSHCYAKSNSNLKEERRTIEETEKIIKKLYNAGVMEWSFTGGEPTVCSDLFKAIQITKSFGMKTSLNTNGCLDDKTIDKIITSGIDELTVSLEGKKETHNKRRGKGTFEKVIRTLDRIHNYDSKTKPKVILNMAIGKDNIDNIKFVTEIAIRYGHDIKFVTMKPVGRATGEFSRNLPTTEEFMKFAKKVQKLREEKEVKNSKTKVLLNHQDLFCSSYSDKSNLPYPFDGSECSATTIALDILPNGDTTACSFLMHKPKFVGLNIIDNSIEKVWNHPALNHFRNAQKQECPDCKFYRERCRGTCRSTVILGGGEIKNKKLIGKDYCCFKSLIDD